MSESDRPLKPARRFRRLRWPARLLLVGAIVAIATLRNFFFGGNFGIVQPGVVYRSGQPHENLRQLVKENRVASILNLRGGSQVDEFYVNELRVAKELGVAYYDFPISAIRRPTRRELLVLIDLFGQCRYPLLIHCKSGSDRTGLASALYLLSRPASTPAEALSAFSIVYGHIPFLGPEHLHEPIEEYKRWLSGAKLNHTPERLRAWVETQYQANDPASRYTPLHAGPRAKSESAVYR